MKVQFNAFIYKLIKYHLHVFEKQNQSRRIIQKQWLKDSNLCLPKIFLKDKTIKSITSYLFFPLNKDSKNINVYSLYCQF